MKAEKCRVLVVDNDDLASDALVNYCVSFGFRLDNIFSVSNGNKALEILDEKEIDLIFSDIRRSSPDGLEFLVNLKLRKDRKKIIFIFYSGGGEPFIRKTAENYGADGFMAKPFTFPEFKTEIMEILKKI